MKKGITLFALTLFVNITFAQHSLLSSEMLGFGSKVIQKYISDLSVIDTTIQGNGVVWDFSSLKNNASIQDLVITIADPNSTPYAAAFPNANYVYIESQSTTNYRFFNLSTDKMERVGSYVSSVNTYSDPQTEYVFPLTLGTKNTDSWNSTNSSFGGTYDLECVGSGTLITPGGTFNALMVRVRMEEGSFETDAYYWYSADNGCPLLSYVIDRFFMRSVGIYANEIITGTNSIDRIEFIQDISYNNPVENTLTFNFNSNLNANYSYAVINSVGKIVCQKASHLDGSKETLNINFSDYPSGMYFVKFSIDGTAKSVKVFKVIKK